MAAAAFPVVGPDVLAAVWPNVEPLVASALAHTSGECTTADVAERLLDGRAALWIMVELDGPMLGILVAEVIHWPQQALANAWIVAGQDLDRWLPVANSTLEAWARARGCAAVIGEGRAGFVRRLAHLGYREVGRKYRKDL
jgi:hypothetical protein